MLHICKRNHYKLFRMSFYLEIRQREKKHTHFVGKDYRSDDDVISADDDDLANRMNTLL